MNTEALKGMMASETLSGAAQGATLSILLDTSKEGGS